MVALRRHLPRTPTDWVAFAFALVSICSIFSYELLHTIPTIFLFSPVAASVHVLLGSFVLFNIFGNLFLLMTTDTSIRRLIMPMEQSSSWRFCASCESLAPPRSYHCDVCQACILRRDHHCIFAGCCVGYRNIRYFLTLLLHLSLGSLYAVVLNSLYLWDLQGASLLTMLHSLFPMVFLFTGQLELWDAMGKLVVVLPVVGFLFVFHLLLFHGRLALGNQTTHEQAHRITFYNLGTVKLNMAAILGERWQLVWLSPFLSSPLLGDGMHYPVNRHRRTPQAVPLH